MMNPARNSIQMLVPGQHEWVGWKSVDSNIPFNVYFLNESNEALYVDWMDQNSNHINKHCIQKGQNAQSPTQVGHPWLIKRQDGQALCLFKNDYNFRAGATITLVCGENMVVRLV